MKKLATLIAVLAFVLVTGFVSAPGTAFAAGKVHVVSKGESLYKIASWYGTTVGSIKKANNYWSDYIKPGQRLTIPSKSSSSTGCKVHVVSKGESLYKIASWYGTSVGAIKQANNNWSDSIMPGQKLIIPSGKTTVKATVNKTSVASASTAGSASSAALPSRGVSTRFSRDEIYLLAKLINAEARGESYEGQVAVGAVVLNRITNSNFPNTLAGVIYQPLAFTAVSDGQMYLEPNATALKAAEAAAGGWDPSGGAIYYYNPAKTNSKWMFSRPIITRIGNHVFAK